MKILIGSKAAKQWLPNFPREPVDIDYITDEEAEQYKGFKLIQDKMRFLGNLPENRQELVAPPEILYTLKISHVYYDIWWDKTIYDIVWYKEQGFEVDEELLKVLAKDWEKKYGAKKINTNISNEEFFMDNVKREYVHDNIHKAVAFYDEPLYRKVKKDLSKAALSKELFDNLDFKDKIKLCLEEINVVSLERFLIPKKFRMHPKTARYMACKQLITSMSKGWFPRFIVDNFRELFIDNNDNTYIEKFKDYFNVA